MPGSAAPSPHPTSPCLTLSLLTLTTPDHALPSPFLTIHPYPVLCSHSVTVSLPQCFASPCPLNPCCTLAFPFSHLSIPFTLASLPASQFHSPCPPSPFTHPGLPFLSLSLATPGTLSHLPASGSSLTLSPTPFPYPGSPQLFSPPTNPHSPSSLSLATLASLHTPTIISTIARPPSRINFSQFRDTDQSMGLDFPTIKRDP